jgi:hypothetical protein
MDLGKKVGCEDVDWAHRIQDRGQWRVLVNTVINVRFQVLTAASMKIAVFWVVAPCSLMP